MYNLFLDDLRMPWAVGNYMFPVELRSMYRLEQWEIVRNYSEFIKIINEKGLPEKVSFDHDLNDNIEEWLPITGYENLYEISSFGRVKSLPRNTTFGKILTSNKTESGLIVSLYKNGIRKRVVIHRLVAQAFLLNPENKPQVNHIDGNRWNNHINNLEWNTNSENVTHSHKYLKRIYTSFAENHKNSLSVSQYHKTGKLIAVYGSVNEAGRQLNISFTNIAKCARGKRKTAGGFIWKYENLCNTVCSKVSYISKENKNYINNFFIPEFKEKTGFDCAKWLINYCIDNKLLICDYYVHSLNPVGTENIVKLIENFKKFENL